MISDSDLYQMERDAFAGNRDSLLAMHVQKLVSEVRSLKHELADPNYLYVGRIHRQAIITRDAQIDELVAEIKGLKSGSEAPK